MNLRREIKIFRAKKAEGRRGDFSARLPQYSQLYAIPYALSQQGLQKYCREGNIHQWALQAINRLEKRKYRKVITVFIGEMTSIAAIQNGNPIDVSDGFCPTGGILSETGCGEIDSAIVFQLLADGVSKGQVEKLLSKQSGFKALAGGLFKLKDVLRRRDAKAKFTREVFCYQILKNIGSYITSLSGLDLILFIGEDQMEIKNLVSELLLSLRFIGVQRKENVFCGEVSLLTESDSLVKAYFLKKKSNKRFL